MLRILTLVEPNSHREPLHYFHVITGRILWREQAEHRTRRAGKTLDVTLVIAPKRVDVDGDRLAGLHPPQLNFFEVCCDPDVIQWNDHKQPLTRLDAMTNLDRFSSDDAAHGRVDFGIAEIQLCGAQICPGLLQMAAGGIRFSARVS